jgi:hypothetical protein
LVMATATTFTTSVMELMWTMSSYAKTDLFLFLTASTKVGAAHPVLVPGATLVPSTNTWRRSLLIVVIFDDGARLLRVNVVRSRCT